MSQISVYARVRPSVSNPYEGLTISNDSVNIAFGVRNDFRYVQPQFKEYTFKFKQVFENTNSSQEDVYDTVAQHMVDKFMDGFNGTIFAYGQTASGKTYTIEGSSRQYKERGLAPRVISEVYRLIKGREENENIALTISYMEIYQDQAYDLLNASNRGTTINTTLPKVTMLEVNGETYFKNLSTHLAPTEQVALHLLFEGGTCRKVAETVMNLSSSRSHTIFTLTLTSQLMGADTLTKSKLHLVDLAGSERVSKTGADGVILQEAKYINLSLHFLEHVIVALQKHSRGKTPPIGTPSVSSPSRPSTSFIPYRNSVLTMVLRDSLGGNCLTSMIATLSPDSQNINETLSTCRFAQRVACISNVVRRNEEMDDKAIIKQLRKRIVELEGQLLIFQNPPEIPLSDTDRAACHKILHSYLHKKIDDPISAGINSQSMFRECMSVMRDVVLHALKSKRTSSSGDSLSNSSPLHNDKDSTPPVQEKGPSSRNKEPSKPSIKGRDSKQYMTNQSQKDVKLKEDLAPEESPYILEEDESLESTIENGSYSRETVSSAPDEATGHHYIKKAVVVSNDRGDTSSKSSEVSSTSHKASRLLEQEKKSLVHDIAHLKLQIKENELNHELNLVSRQLNKQNNHILDSCPDQSHEENLIRQQLQSKQKKLLEKLSVTKDHIKLIQQNSMKPPSGDHKENSEQVKDEIEKLKLAQFEKQLELKEANTRHRLAMLKQQLIAEHVKTSNDVKTHTHTNQIGNVTTTTTAHSSSPDNDVIPRESGEMYYSSSVQKQRERVQRIRECIKAAIVIQRSWRFYKYKKVHHK